MKNIYIFLFFCFVSTEGITQVLLTSEELSELKLFTDVEEAILKKDSVFRLQISYWEAEKHDDFDFSALSNLQELLIWDIGKKQQKIINEISQLKNLQSLTFCMAEMNEIPEEFYSLVHLKRLNLMLNSIQTISPKIKTFEKLETLNLSRNHINKLPIEICELRHLKELNLSENKLTELPETIGELNKLERLDISNNKIKTLPLSLQNAVLLEHLKCTNNDFTKIPKHIKGLPKLTELYVDYPFPINFYKEYDVSYFKIGYDYFHENGLEVSFLLDKTYNLDVGIYGPSLGFEVYPFREDIVFGPKVSAELIVLIAGFKISAVEYISKNQNSLHISPSFIFTFSRYFNLEYSYSLPIYNRDFVDFGHKFSVLFQFPLSDIRKNRLRK